MPGVPKYHLFIDIFRDSHVGKIQLAPVLWVGEWQVAHLKGVEQLFEKNGKISVLTKYLKMTNQGHLERKSRSMGWWVDGKNRSAAGLKVIWGTPDLCKWALGNAIEQPLKITTK